MCLCGNLPFSTVSPAQFGCYEIFILFFDDDLAWGFIYSLGSGSKRRACERQKKTEGGERRVDGEVGRITMQLFSFQLMNGF